MTSGNPRRALVIGSSQAGVQLAISMRDNDYPGSITLLGAEVHEPYQRPPLSKAVLLTDGEMAALELRTPAFYAERGIELVLGERIASIERADDGHGTARSASGREFAFDDLAFTVGARPIRLAVPGADLDRVLYLRSVEDALALKQRLATAHRIVVVGGGFIGLEVAASARQLGKEVTVVLADGRVMSRAVGPMVSEFFEAAHRRRGVEVRVDAAVTRILDDGAGAARGIALGDGSEVEADLVLIGIGAAPRTELAEQLGLEVNNGIVVDECSLCSDGRTVAAGDCANVPNPMAHGHGLARLRFESVNNAIEHARAAGATLSGTPTAYRSTPWFWSDQFDLKLQVAGVPDQSQDLVVRGVPEDERFSILRYHGERLVSAECINTPLDFLAVRAAIGRGLTIPRAAAGDLSVPLKRSATPLTELSVR